MLISFENEYDENLEKILGFPFEAVAEEVLGAALEAEGCPYEAEVSILFVGEEEIREINRDTRGIDAVTDVLSFPMFAYATPADFSTLDDAPEIENFDPETGNLLLGDIVLCIPRVLSQAREYGHPVRREYAFLLAHSLLHLLGYDHILPEEALEMEKRQESVLEKLGITR